MLRMHTRKVWICVRGRLLFINTLVNTLEKLTLNFRYTVIFAVAKNFKAKSQPSPSTTE